MRATRLMTSAAAAAAAFAFAAPAFAQFSPGPNPITGTTGAQTLSGGTGTINSGGKISITTNGVALTMTGTSTLVNNGTIQTTGTGRAIDSNSGTANLTVTNTGLISAASSDAFRVNTNSSVSLINSGTIQVTNGGQAIDWAAITSKSNSLTNQAGGVITAVGDDAVRMGTNGVVDNAGLISATPVISGGAASGSDGIDVRTFTGVQVTNSGTITGRSGIATDGSNTGPTVITVTNNAGGMIAGQNGSGINIDGVSASVVANVTNAFGATFKGGVMAGVTDADGDGIDVDGVLNLNNSGDVLGLGAVGNNNAEGLAIGGGTIINTATGRIIGSSTAADAPNGDPTRGGNGILADDSNGGSAVAATSITNSGLIQGKNGFAIKLNGTFANTVTNNAGGLIEGSGATAGAAVQTGDGNDVITNSGTIKGDNGLAIDMQGGNNTLNITGGSASVIGSINGGSGGSNVMKMDPGAGNAFAYAGSISNFNTVQVVSGTVTLSDVNTYTGTTQVSGGRLILDGANRIAAASALNMNGGTLEIANAGAANGQSFSSLSLTGNSVIDLDGTSLTFGGLGTVDAGKTLAFLDYVAANSPAYAFRLLGDYTSNASFLALLGQTTINGLGAAYAFDGVYTNIAAVPEPSSYAMLALGVVVLVSLRRTRSA